MELEINLPQDWAGRGSLVLYLGLPGAGLFSSTPCCAQTWIYFGKKTSASKQWQLPYLTRSNRKVEAANRWVEHKGTVKCSRLAKAAAAPAGVTCPSNCQPRAGLRFSGKCYRDFLWEGGDAYLYDAHGPKPGNSQPRVFVPAGGWRWLMRYYRAQYNRCPGWECCREMELLAKAGQEISVWPSFEKRKVSFQLEGLGTSQLGRGGKEKLGVGFRVCWRRTSCHTTWLLGCYSCAVVGAALNVGMKMCTDQGKGLRHLGMDKSDAKGLEEAVGGNASCHKPFTGSCGALQETWWVHTLHKEMALVKKVLVNWWLNSVEKPHKNIVCDPELLYREAETQSRWGRMERWCVQGRWRGNQWQWWWEWNRVAC